MHHSKKLKKTKKEKEKTSKMSTISKIVEYLPSEFKNGFLKGLGNAVAIGILGITLYGSYNIATIVSAEYRRRSSKPW